MTALSNGGRNDVREPAWGLFAVLTGGMVEFPGGLRQSVSRL
jgi:hypothetical protein